MESATGGAIASAITDVAGSSSYFRGGIVAYATEAKIAHGVPADVPAAHGVISRETAEAMAAAARERLGADLGLGLTGIAGAERGRGPPPRHDAPRAVGRPGRVARDVVVLPRPRGGEAPRRHASAEHGSADFWLLISLRGKGN